MDGTLSSDVVTFMHLAVEEAKKALARLEVPVGCVIVENGKVIGSGSNRVNETRNATRHAEMEAVDMILAPWTPSECPEAGSIKEQLTKKFGECELYVTCEPCIMCAAALAILGIKKVYYGCGNDRFGGCGSILPLDTDGCGGCGNSSSGEDDGDSAKRRGFECVGGILADEGIALLRGFYEQGNPNAPRPHRPVRAQDSSLAD
ncbi:tRNA-specific adenosine deaminase 2 [Marchantia polymorpha subsp. ruderalis]|nr:hypothetical protein MARPO_0047s0093 [Marchantia polymorpha]BBN14773.1 hypothetical protein Mp_6g14390 [Marchantia polymorpha subsp. ruderalis]|eukprot:PTQ39118.1 hypothetical protein MARPO_0047s0093 [Marchantia polymorpha]